MKAKLKLGLLLLAVFASLGVLGDDDPVWSQSFSADTESIGQTITINDASALTYSAAWLADGERCRIKAVKSSQTYQILSETPGDGDLSWFYDPEMAGPDYTLICEILNASGSVVGTFTASVSLDNPVMTEFSPLFPADSETMGTTFELLDSDQLAYSTEWKGGDAASIIAKCDIAGVADHIIYSTGDTPEEGSVNWNYLAESPATLPRNGTYTLTHCTFESESVKDDSLTATVRILPEPGLLALLGIVTMAFLKKATGR